MTAAQVARRRADDAARRRLPPTAGRSALTVSFGVAELHAGSGTAGAMLADADRALYAAKRAGRDRVVRSDEMDAATAAA